MKSRDALWGVAVLAVGLLGVGVGAYTDQAFPDVVPYFAHHSTGRVDTTALQQALRLIAADSVDGNIDPKKLSHGTITGTVAGAPAAAAGLQPGDQIVKVGDKDMKGITADQASTLIQGPDG